MFTIFIYFLFSHSVIYGSAKTHDDKKNKGGEQI